MISYNTDLSKYTRFKTGGVAEVFFEPETQEELINFLKNKNYKKPLNVIGACSNILIMDGLIEGTIINTKKLNKVKIENDFLVAECGVLNSKVFSIARQNEIANFEFLGCIPGTIGGACKTNAGCYNFELKDILEKIKVVDFEGNIKYYTVEECGMAYRKNNLPDNLIYLELFFKTEKNAKENIDKTFKEMFFKKKDSQPIYENTCGSTFKNIDKDTPAWKIIKDLGLQGIDFNGVVYSNKHANFLINKNNKYSKNIKDLIDLTINRAKNELNIDLELEIQIIGNKNG